MLERLIKLTLTLSDQMEEQTKAINKGTTLVNEARHAATTAHSDTLRLIDDLHRKQRQDRRWLPWVGLGAVILVLVLTALLPRFLASNPSTCAVLGATWMATTEGINACVFYQR